MKSSGAFGAYLDLQSILTKSFWSTFRDSGPLFYLPLVFRYEL